MTKEITPNDGLRTTSKLAAQQNCNKTIGIRDCSGFSFLNGITEFQLCVKQYVVSLVQRDDATIMCTIYRKGEAQNENSVRIVGKNTNMTTELNRGLIYLKTVILSDRSMQDTSVLENSTKI